MSANIQSIQPSVDTRLFIQATDWTELTFVKQSSGIVVVGTKESLTPVGQGHGMSLPMDIPVTIRVGPSTNVFIVAEDDQQKVAVCVQPMTWIREIIEFARVMSASVAASAPPPQFGTGKIQVAMPDEPHQAPIGLGSYEEPNAVDPNAYYRSVHGVK